jgi:hypothetical protein
MLNKLLKNNLDNVSPRCSLESLFVTTASAIAPCFEGGGFNFEAARLKPLRVFGGEGWA